jgi:outer membrane protein assembly factor BamB
VASIAASAAAAEAKKGDWTQFRGPGGSATSAETGLPAEWSAEKNIVWKTELPGKGTSSPILIGERIYLTCYSGYDGRGADQDGLTRHLVAISRSTGEVEWKKVMPTKLPEQEKIRDDHGYASSTPAADSERIYVFNGKSGVVAFDHQGKQLWHTDVGDKLNGWGSASSPVLLDNLVLINASVESDSLYALDRKTGKEIWRTKGIKEAWNTPLVVPVGDKHEIIVAMPHHVRGYDPANGKELWSCKTECYWYMAPSMVAHDGVVYCIGGRTGTALAVRVGGRGDVTESHRLWLGKKGSNVSSPVYHDGHLYWMNDSQGIAYCADAKTGKLVYEERVRRADQVYSSPVVADGKIYYFARSGRAFVMPAKPEYELISTNDLESRGMFNASPAVADGRLFIRSDKFLYCLGLK